MSEIEKSIRPVGCGSFNEATPCRFYVMATTKVGFTTCTVCWKEIHLQDALNAMFARLEAAEKR